MSGSEELSDENSYESCDTKSDILEELVDKFKYLKPYQVGPEKEVITGTDKSEEDWVMMGAKI